MPPELLALLKKEVSFHKAGLEHLARQIPSQEKLDEWLEESIRTYHDGGFVLLSLAGLHAGLVLQGKHLERGLMLLGNDEHYGPFFAWRSSGDVPALVLSAIENTFIFPKSQAALLVMVVLWCQEQGHRPVPPAAFSLTRQLFRTFFHLPDVAPHLLFIAGLTQEPGLVAVGKARTEGLKGVDFSHWTEVAEKSRGLLLERWKGPALRGVPEKPPAPSRVLAAGTTMRRAVERTGRNEPCHCGSGKKYKHCCISKDDERLHHSSPIAGVTREEALETPEHFLTLENFDDYPNPHLLPKLDPLKLRPELLGKFFGRLAFTKSMDRVIEMLPLVPWTEEILEAWRDAMFFAAKDRKIEVLRRLAALRPPGDMHAGNLRHRMAELGLAEGNPREELRLIHETARDMLGGDNNEEGLISAAETLLCSRHHELGILVARGVIPLLPPAKAAELFKYILEARDRLNLPPGDEFSDIVDKMLLKNRSEEHDDRDAAALRKAQRNLEKKAEEVRALKESLAQVQRDLELKERKHKRAAAENTAQPTAEERKEATELRARVEELKSTLKQTHLERNEFRRDLEQAQSELEQLRAAQPPPDKAEAADPEESLLLPPEPATAQPVRLLEFPKKFDEMLHAVPKHIARNTMVTLGQIAGGEASALAGAVRLKACPDITRQRIGSDHRLLFRLLPDRVQVVTLINRRDLERTIKSLS